jgi:cold shock protein
MIDKHSYRCYNPYRAVWLIGMFCDYIQEVWMAIGKVKWFSDAKGYGFITCTEDAGDGQGDIFVHYSEIAKDGFRTLEHGQEVTFELLDTPKGLQAKKVQPLS